MREVGRFANQCVEALAAEFLLMDICGLEQAVSVENEAVAGPYGMTDSGVRGETESGKHQAVLADFDDLAVPEKEHGRMRCARVAEFLRGRVEVNVGCGDKLAVCIATKNSVHTVEKAGWVVGVSAMGSGSELNHRCDERGRDAMAGDISDK